MYRLRIRTEKIRYSLPMTSRTLYHSNINAKTNSYRKRIRKQPEKAQIYLDKLEWWTSLWRLCLAPHKCAQVIFSKAASTAHDDLDLNIYGQKIPYDPSPKFLGIIFDPRLKFDKHLELMKEKVKDRTNVLKVLSYDKHWALGTNFLVNIYKVLVRSVMDYSNTITGACSKNFIDASEVLQNNALRVIFKVSVMDHVSIESLRAKADICSMEERYENLLTEYYEKCLINNNPLMSEMFDSYRKFKHRNFLPWRLAEDGDGAVDLSKLDLIKKHNKEALNTETHMTTLCRAREIIKELIVDEYDWGPIGSNLR